MLRKIGSPRFIDPSLIEIGDEISVEHKPDKGITTTLKGVVAKRMDSGETRYLMTVEGATLLAWSPKKTSKYRVTLLGREEPENATIFDLLDETKDRIAS